VVDVQVGVIEHPAHPRQAPVPLFRLVIDGCGGDIVPDGRIPAQPPAGFGVQVAGAVVVKAGLGVPLFSGIAAAGTSVEGARCQARFSGGVG